MRCFHCNGRLSAHYKEVDFQGTKVKLHMACVPRHKDAWSSHPQTWSATAVRAAADVEKAMRS